MGKIESALDCPVVLSHLPTSDRGIHFSAPAGPMMDKFLYQIGRLDNPIATSNLGTRQGVFVVVVPSVNTASFDEWKIQQIPLIDTLYDRFSA